jgi:hypothetical protein
MLKLTLIWEKKGGQIKYLADRQFLELPLCVKKYHLHLLRKWLIIVDLTSVCVYVLKR